MRFAKAYVPYGAYWSTPFCKWQGSLSHLNAIALAGDTATRALAARFPWVMTAPLAAPVVPEV